MKKMVLSLAIVAVAIGAYVCVRAASANVRNLNVTWNTDPARHIDPGFIQVTADSSTGTDFEIELEVRDATNAVVNSCMIGNDMTTPFDGVVDPVRLKTPVTSYGHGAQFTAIATFRDAAGTTLATLSQPCMKP